MTTMREKYGEPDDELGNHEVCDSCGYCATCGDCICAKQEKEDKEEVCIQTTNRV